MATFDDILDELPTIEDGSEIREIRKKHLNWTQKELGAALGVTGNTIARWERNEVNIDNPLMLGLALEALVGRYDEEMIAKCEALRQKTQEGLARLGVSPQESDRAMLLSGTK